MKSLKKTVVLGAAMLSLSVMLDAFANPIIPIKFRVQDSILYPDAITVENCAEIGKAASKVREGLNELKTLLEDDSGSRTNHIFIYRAGRRYSFDVSDRMLEVYDRRRVPRVVKGVDYCRDDLYLVDGQIVPGSALIEKLIEKIHRKSIRSDRRGTSFVACCIKEGKEIVNEERLWREEEERDRREEEWWKRRLEAEKRFREGKRRHAPWLTTDLLSDDSF